jgi:hypothetical protein
MSDLPEYVRPPGTAGDLAELTRFIQKLRDLGVRHYTDGNITVDFGGHKPPVATRKGVWHEGGAS